MVFLHGCWQFTSLPRFSCLVDTQFKDGCPVGWLGKREGQKRDVALCLSCVIVLTEALEKGGQPAPEHGLKNYGKMIFRDLYFTLITKPQEKQPPLLWR